MAVRNPPISALRESCERRRYVGCLYPLVIKLWYRCADTSGMDGRDIEPRVLMWAVAEISWQESSGEQVQTRATLEDTSKSGACVRLKRPLAVGAMVMIKWQREQFAAVARNCRKDGRDFLVGVCRKAQVNGNSKAEPVGMTAAVTKSSEANSSSVEDHPLLLALHAERERRLAQETGLAAHRIGTEVTPNSDSRKSENCSLEPANPQLGRATSAAAEVPVNCSQLGNVSVNSGAPPRQERKDMEPKVFFPTFWHRAKASDSREPNSCKEVVVNENRGTTTAPSIAGREMLSYEDIYDAAGIMTPASGYGIQKVLEMLNSERIRNLSGDVKRASILMALEVAGTSADDVLSDATRRQEALKRYESGKKKQLEEFEATKTRENNQTEEEMERVRAHYAERMQRNRDLVAQEKEALRNWQMAMQHEMERIADVIDVCRQPPASEVTGPVKLSPETTPAPAHPAAAGRSS